MLQGFLLRFSQELFKIRVFFTILRANSNRNSIMQDLNESHDWIEGEEPSVGHMPLFKKEFRTGRTFENSHAPGVAFSSPAEFLFLQTLKPPW